jgi:hypothetical protein
MNCSECNKEMEKGFLYIRGFGAALLWSDRHDTPAVSRRGMEQIDLSKVGVSPSRQQAVIHGYRCPDCGEINFKTKRNAMPFVQAARILDGVDTDATETR